MIAKADNPALILIDIQKGFDDIEYWGGERNNLQAEENAYKLLEVWRQYQLPVFHVKHCSSNPVSPLRTGQIGNEFKDGFQPVANEIEIKKEVNSGFIGTALKEHLDSAGIKKLVVAGLTTDHCVSTTTRMAGNFGYEVLLLSDATATFCKIGVTGERYSAELIHNTALASLHKEFATVVTTHDVINNLMTTR